jgi:protein-tyrosine phosphatase
MTDGMCPDHNDVDEIHSSLSSAPDNTSFVFSCQQGKGRTTVCMVLALLHATRKVLSSSNLLICPFAPFILQ